MDEHELRGVAKRLGAIGGCCDGDRDGTEDIEILVFGEAQTEVRAPEFRRGRVEHEIVRGDGHEPVVAVEGAAGDAEPGEIRAGVPAESRDERREAAQAGGANQGFQGGDRSCSASGSWSR